MAIDLLNISSKLWLALSDWRILFNVFRYNDHFLVFPPQFITLGPDKN